MLWKVDRSQGEPKLIRVNPDSLAYDPNKRRVLLFPGANLADQTGEFQGAKPYVGSIKYVEQTLKSSIEKANPPVDIYLYTYEQPGEDYGAMAPHYAMQRSNLSLYGRYAHNHALLPMILQPNERLSDLTPDTLKERLSHITMIGHSYGSIAMQDVANVMLFELRRAGWDEKDIAETLKEAVSISVASVARIDYPQPNFTQFFFTSGRDITAIDWIRTQNPNPADHIPLLRQCGYGRAADVLERHDGAIARPQLLEEIKEDILRTRRMRNGVPMPKLQMTPSGFHIRSMLPDDNVRWMEEKHDGTEVCRVLNTSQEETTGVKVGHDYRTYLHGDHLLGDVLINVANNAVQRDVGIGDGSQLRESNEMTRGQHAHKYASNARAHISERGIVNDSGGITM